MLEPVNESTGAVDLALDMSNPRNLYAAMWDNQRTQRVEFGGRKWYPIQESYRLNDQFIAYQPVKVILFPNELGEVEENEAVGYVRFTLGERNAAWKWWKLPMIAC